MTILTDQLEALQTEATTQINTISDSAALQEWYAEYLGKKGRLTTILRGLGQVAAEDRPFVGKAANEVRVALETAYEARREEVEHQETNAALQRETVDVTLPGRRYTPGALHPITQVTRELIQIFGQMGFQVYDSPEVETDEYNFELLNMPPGHPARDMWDTFYTTTPGQLLRTHTSPGQLHAMREFAPDPIRVIVPGKCYRYEQVSARAEMMFTQIEGIAIGRRITFSDLKGVLQNFADQLFGPGRKLRFRKSYFPFTEPSVEVDVDCVLCGGAGCNICKYSGWLEILGAGMVHPTVLKNGGYDPAIHTGFAFGMGPERSAMIKYGINDLRLFFSNDVRLFERLR